MLILFSLDNAESFKNIKKAEAYVMKIEVIKSKEYDIGVLLLRMVRLLLISQKDITNKQDLMMS